MKDRLNEIRDEIEKIDRDLDTIEEQIDKELKR